MSQPVIAPANLDLTTDSPATRRRRATDRTALLGLCLAAFAGRLAGLTAQSLWRDEVDSLRFAGRPLAELLHMFVKPGENGPLYFLLLRPWLELAGQSEFALRWPSAAAGVLAVPLVYALTRLILRLTGGGPHAGLTLNNVPLVTALLVAINPYLIWYSQEGKMYAALVVLVLAAHLAFLAAVAHGRWWRWLVYLALLAVSALVHVLAVLMVLVHAVWLGCLWPQSRRSVLPFAVTLLVPALPYFALAGWWQVRLFLSPDFQTGHAVVPLPQLAAALLTGAGQGVAAPASPWILAGLIFLALAGATLGVTGDGMTQRRAGLRLAAMTVSWLALPALALFAISLRKPLFTDRYVIWTLPALAMLLALGLKAVARAWRPLGWLSLGLVVTVALQAGWRQAHTPIKADFRAAAAYVQAHRQPGDRLLFQIPYVRYNYEYYAGAQSDWADGPYTNNDNPPQQVAAEMAQATAGAPAVWLVLSEEPLWDRRALARQWLEEHGQRTDQATFARVQITRYALSGP